jgi:FkbM family methyltransferase
MAIMRHNDRDQGDLEKSLRRKVFAYSLLRLIGRGIIHLKPSWLGKVSEGYEGTFSMRPFGYRLRYELGPKDTIGNILHWCGYRTFETETLPEFVKYAQNARGVLDIGANTGLFSMLACAANPKARVIAWEPVPYLNEKCARNLALNGFSTRCEVRDRAVSSQAGRASLYIPEETTTASLNPAHKSDGKPFEVIVETIDESLPADFPLDLVKIDVETHETEVLWGMQDTLRRARPTVFFECLPSLDPVPIQDLFHSLGYQLYQLTPRGPVKVERIAPGGTIDNNFLATSRERSGE